ncbi:MAG: ABC transporter ATP-binding protein [Thaumarchaeota archaeon]|nr:ABC transporter ATP-binding protein [Nitrososphaerota archaeon]
MSVTILAMSLIKNLSPFRTLMKYIARQWKLLLLFAFMSIVSSEASVLGPYVIMNIIDKGMVEKNFNQLTFYIVALIVLTIVGSVSDFIISYSTRYFSNNLAKDLRFDLFRSIQSKSFAFFDRSRVGQLVSRMTSDVDEIRGFFDFNLRFLTSSILTFVLALATMVTLNIELTLVTLASLPVMLLVIFLFNRKISPIFWDIRNKVGQLTATLQESLSGYKLVKAMATEDQEINRFDAVNRSLLLSNYQASKVRSIYLPFTGLIVSLIYALLIWYGGLLVINQKIMIGEVVAFATYMGMFVGPVRMLGFMYEGMKRALVAMRRLTDIMEANVVIPEKPNAIELPNLKGKVEFRNVSFSYKDEPTLKDVSFVINPGEKVAVVGPIGSGKTTVLNLIPRFYDVTSGKVLIDDVDVRDLKLSFLRKVVAVVPQETFLFPTTIRENIAFGKKDASMEEIIAAAKAAQIHDTIEKFPNGYETLVGERGVTLSGGQRQRIAIARALLVNPRIVLLDDSTSSVDVETESAIQKALDKLLEGRTAVIITNRLSTVQKADKIILMNEGRVEAIGKFNELYEKSELFRSLFSKQMEELVFSKEVN